MWSSCPRGHFEIGVVLDAAGPREFNGGLGSTVNSPQSRKTNVPPAAEPLSPWHRHRHGRMRTVLPHAAVQKHMHATMADRALQVHWFQRSGGHVASFTPIFRVRHFSPRDRSVHRPRPRGGL